MESMLAGYGWVLPDQVTLALLIGIGVIGGLGQICLTAAYRHADASVVAPFEYSSMIFAIAIGWSFFGEIPSRTVLGGAAIVILAGILIIWRERKLAATDKAARGCLGDGE